MGDLISRAAAIESLGECPYNWNDWPEEIQAVDDWESHKKALEDLPAVDAIPVEWLREKANGNDFVIGRAARFILRTWEQEAR